MDERMNERMDIYAKEGDLVIVTEKSAKSGLEEDVANVGKHLKIGKVYTVERTEVGGWCTDVILKEVPGVRFNSVNFVDFKNKERG